MWLSSYWWWWWNCWYLNNNLMIFLWISFSCNDDNENNDTSRNRIEWLDIIMKFHDIAGHYDFFIYFYFWILSSINDTHRTKFTLFNLIPWIVYKDVAYGNKAHIKSQKTLFYVFSTNHLSIRARFTLFPYSTTHNILFH